MTSGLPMPDGAGAPQVDLTSGGRSKTLVSHTTASRLPSPVAMSGNVDRLRRPGRRGKAETSDLAPRRGHRPRLHPRWQDPHRHARRCTRVTRLVARWRVDRLLSPTHRGSAPYVYSLRTAKGRATSLRPRRDRVLHEHPSGRFRTARRSPFWTMPAPCPSIEPYLPRSQAGRRRADLRPDRDHRGTKLIAGFPIVCLYADQPRRVSDKFALFPGPGPIIPPDRCPGQRARVDPVFDTGGKFICLLPRLGPMPARSRTRSTSPSRTCL